MNTTTNKYEVFICNINDGIAASLVGKRVYNWMNNPKLNKDMATCGFSISIIGTFDNNYVYLVSDRTLIDKQSAKVVEILIKTYFEILLPFMPDTQIIFKNKPFTSRK